MRNIISIIFFLGYTGAFAQNRCGAMQYRNNLETSVDFLNKIKDFEAAHALQNRSVRYIQVVIHVVARSEQNPISRAQVLHQLDVLNADFADNGENRFKLLEPFENLTRDAEMHFCLASVDPVGKPTSGITFTQTDQFNFGVKYGFEGRRAIQWDLLGGKSGWPVAQYINVWVGEMGDLLGSATMPGEANFPEETGIIIDLRHFGSIGTAGSPQFISRGHTLTHEMGHYLGLKHIWGNGLSENCVDSDDIADTPNQSGPYYGCPQDEQFSCDNSNMFQNFMDLTDDRCLAAFTKDQVTRMNAVVDLYYQELGSSFPCSEFITSFDTWYDDLTWSTDYDSKKMIISSADIFSRKIDVTVYSIDGKLLYQTEWVNEQTTLINLQPFGSGVFIVYLQDGGESKVRKYVMY